MIVYMITLLVCLFLGYGLRIGENRQRKRVFLAIMAWALLLISGLRDYSVGIDTEGYTNLFSRAEYISGSRYEEGFIAYLRLLSTISDNPQILLFISSMICIFSVEKFVDKYSTNAVISMALYITLGAYFSQMNTMRQALSTAILLHSFMLMIEKRSIISFAMIILAYCFHSIAIIALIPFLLWTLLHEWIKKVLKPNTIVKWSIGLSVGTYIAYGLIMNVVTSFFPYFSTYFRGAWSDTNYGASLINTLIQFVFMIVGVFYFRKKEFNRVELFSSIMLVFAIVFSTLSMRMEIWSRVADMFTIYTALLWVPLFTVRIKETFERAFVEYSIIVSSFMYMIIILVFRPEWTGVVPYVFGGF